MNDLERIVQIYRETKNSRRVDGNIEGDLDVMDPWLLTFLQQSDDSSRSTQLGLTILSDPEDIKLGGSLPIRLFSPDDLPVYRNLDSYLGKASRILRQSRKFYLVDENWYSDDPNPKSDTLKLDALHRALTELCRAATIVNDQHSRMVFVDETGHFDIPINLNSQILNTMSIETVDKFAEFCSDSLHGKHRLDALAKAIIRKIRGVPTERRIHCILSDLEAILEDAQSEHAVFISAFSFDRVRDEVQALKVEYTSKIHKAISDIQGQLLGIPVAIVVVASQMENATAVGAEFAKNSALFIGVLIFGVFLSLLIKNQKHTLDVLDSEVKRQKQQLRYELQNVAAKFDDTFEELFKRLRHQRLIIRIVNSVVISGVVVSLTAYLLLSSDAIIFLYKSIVN